MLHRPIIAAQPRTSVKDLPENGAIQPCIQHLQPFLLSDFFEDTGQTGPWGGLSQLLGDDLDLDLECVDGLDQACGNCSRDSADDERGERVEKGVFMG